MDAWGYFDPCPRCGREPLPKDFICLKCQYGNHQHRCLQYGCTCKAPTTGRRAKATT